MVQGEALIMPSAPLGQIRGYQYIVREQTCLCLLLMLHINGIWSFWSDWCLQRSCTRSQHGHAGQEACSGHCCPLSVILPQAGGSSFATTLGGSEGSRIGAIPEGEVGVILMSSEVSATTHPARNSAPSFVPSLCAQKAASPGSLGCLVTCPP